MKPQWSTSLLSHLIPILALIYSVSVFAKNETEYITKETNTLASIHNPWNISKGFNDENCQDYHCLSESIKLAKTLIGNGTEMDDAKSILYECMHHGINLQYISIVHETSLLLSSIHAETDSPLAPMYELLAELSRDSLNALHQVSRIRQQGLQIELAHQKDSLQTLTDLARNQKQAYLQISLGSVALALMVIGFISYKHHGKLRKKIEYTEQLESELKKNRHELHNQTLNMIHLNNSLDEVQTKLKTLKPKINGHGADLQRVINSISLNKTLEKEWENFHTYFNHSHEDFMEKINNLPIDLSISEKRLCTLLKMDLSNKEIASILNIESKSVRMAKYRLKRKLKVEEQLDITSYLQNL
jgi:DNA-binding CsgD family transcriptional regulator